MSIIRAIIEKDYNFARETISEELKLISAQKIEEMKKMMASEQYPIFMKTRNQKKVAMDVLETLTPATSVNPMKDAESSLETDISHAEQNKLMHQHRPAAKDEPDPLQSPEGKKWLKDKTGSETVPLTAPSMPFTAPRDEVLRHQYKQEKQNPPTHPFDVLMKKLDDQDRAKTDGSPMSNQRMIPGSNKILPSNRFQREDFKPLNAKPVDSGPVKLDQPTAPKIDIPEPERKPIEVPKQAPLTPPKEIINKPLTGEDDPSGAAQRYRLQTGYSQLAEARIRVIKARIRGGQIQRRKKVSNVPGYTLRSGKMTRMSAMERRRRKLGAKKAARKVKGKMTRILMKRQRSLQKRQRLGL